MVVHAPQRRDVWLGTYRLVLDDASPACEVRAFTCAAAQSVAIHVARLSSATARVSGGVYVAVESDLERTRYEFELLFDWRALAAGNHRRFATK